MSDERAREVLAELAAAGVTALDIDADSRKVGPGIIFAAWPGFVTDGRRFIPAAVQNGAAAVLWDDTGGYSPSGLTVPGLAVSSLRQLSGFLAHRVHDGPSERLWVTGVTGTNGKTTVSQWIAAALGELGVRCAVVGTLGNGFPGALDEPVNTTPDALALHRQLAGFVRDGGEAVAMEVSSIGLEQGRVNAVAFDVAVFTNLSRDHLDYHKSMEAYGEAKARLFEQPGLRRAVINIDDAFGLMLARRVVERGLDVIVVTRMAANADAVPGARVLLADDLRTVASGLRFAVNWGSARAEVQVRLVADFNVSNLLAVVAALLHRDMPLEDILRAIARLSPPAGRMQLIGGVGEPLVVVDYAHSPDALAKVLEASRPTAQARGGQLVCVFGCGGDRDPGKRPMMGEIAGQLADRVIVTSDNPRSEDPLAILADICVGIRGEFESVLDRRVAIRRAIVEAGADDVVVLAGKGHEPYQEIAGQKQPFSDIEEARDALLAWHRGGECAS